MKQEDAEGDVRFVVHLPDLIHPEEYATDPDGRCVRVQIRVTPEGVEILGDSPRAAELEALLRHAGRTLEQMLCG